MKAWLFGGACTLALLGGGLLGRATSTSSSATKPPSPCDAPVRLDHGERNPGALPPRRIQPRARVPARVQTSWQRLVAEQPEATQLLQQAIQARMSDMAWARTVTDCAQILPPSPSKVRFTATIHNAGGELTIVEWSAYVTDGPDVPEAVLACVREGLPRGALALTGGWPGADERVEYELDMSLEGTGQAVR